MIPDTLNIFYDEELIGTPGLSPADDFEFTCAAARLSLPEGMTPFSGHTHF